MGGRAKLAPIVVAWFTVIVHDEVKPADAQAPLHPRKLPPPAAAAVSVSCVPSTRSSLQSPLCEVPEMAQLIPEPATAPEPVPPVPARTVTTYLGGGGGVKLASTVVF